jgi:hypothetical protein
MLPRFAAVLPLNGKRGLRVLSRSPQAFISTLTGSAFRVILGSAGRARSFFCRQWWQKNIVTLGVAVGENGGRMHTAASAARTKRRRTNHPATAEPAERKPTKEPSQPAEQRKI